MVLTRRAVASPPRLFGAADAAAYLGISPTTLRGLGLRTVRLGARVLWPREELDAYADSLIDGADPAGEGNTCDAALARIAGKARR
jgi:hypothetical protein